MLKLDFKLDHLMCLCDVVGNGNEMHYNLSLEWQ